MRIFFLIFLTAFFTLSHAGDVIGSVEQLNGVVKVKSVDSFKKTKVKVGFEIKAGEMLITSKKSSAVIKLVDGSTIVLDASASISFASASSLEQKGGKVYYKITSRDSLHALAVSTPFAIIGIKGTTFIVNSTDGEASVILKEGLIGVASIKEEFNLYRKSVEAEYNKFKEEQMSEFEKFKNQQNKYADPIKTKEFDLKEGNRISFNENRVNEDAWSKDDEAEFAHFQELMNLTN